MGWEKKRYSGLLLLLFSLCFCPAHTVSRIWSFCPANTSLHAGTSEVWKCKSRGAEPRLQGTCAYVMCIKFKAFLVYWHLLCIVDDDCADIGSRALSPRSSAASWAETVRNRMTLAASTCTELFPTGTNCLTHYDSKLRGSSSIPKIRWLNPTDRNVYSGVKTQDMP